MFLITMFEADGKFQFLRRAREWLDNPPGTNKWVHELIYPNFLRVRLCGATGKNNVTTRINVRILLMQINQFLMPEPLFFDKKLSNCTVRLETGHKLLGVCFNSAKARIELSMLARWKIDRDGELMPDGHHTAGYIHPGHRAGIPCMDE